jgi:hypothetical protein
MHLHDAGSPRRRRPVSDAELRPHLSAAARPCALRGGARTGASAGFLGLCRSRRHVSRHHCDLRPATAHAAARSQAVIREAGQHGTEAEVLVSILLRLMHQGLETHWPAARALLNQEWKPSKPSRGPLGAEEVQRVCIALREAQQRWQALALGEASPFRGRRRGEPEDRLGRLRAQANRRQAGPHAGGCSSRPAAQRRNQG